MTPELTPPSPGPTDPHHVKRPKIMMVYGTRPEAIKMAPLVLALVADGRFDVCVVTTGQHKEMLEQVNTSFGITPDHDLGIYAPGQSLEQVTVRTLERLGRVLYTEAPSAVLVQGDTTTTFASALAAFYASIPVIHTEAGLRTADSMNPYPEEMNRRLTTRMAALHLAPTVSARENLFTEGVDPANVIVTGNSVIDALHLTLKQNVEFDDARLVARSRGGRDMVLFTAHRRESWGAPMERIGRALAQLARRFPDTDFVFPAHRNPLVRQAILPAVNGLSNVLVTEPLPYEQFCRLLREAAIILTDSGGVQEEGPALGKPVLVMRETTERPEAVDAGTARLVGTDEDTIVSAVGELLVSCGAYDAMAHAVNPYGDGRAAERTVASFGKFFGLGDVVEEFAAGGSLGDEEDPAAEFTGPHHLAHAA